VKFRAVMLPQRWAAALPGDDDKARFALACARRPRHKTAGFLIVPSQCRERHNYKG
jgi:hypothetical protein